MDTTLNAVAFDYFAVYTEIILQRNAARLDHSNAGWLKHMYLSMLADYVIQAQYKPFDVVFGRVPMSIINGMRNAVSKETASRIEIMFARVPHRVSA